eukprot:4341563-Amphidinium_carterae.1
MIHSSKLASLQRGHMEVTNRRLLSYSVRFVRQSTCGIFPKEWHNMAIRAIINAMRCACLF